MNQVITSFVSEFRLNHGAEAERDLNRFITRYDKVKNLEIRKLENAAKLVPSSTRMDESRRKISRLEMEIIRLKSKIDYLESRPSPNSIGTVI